MCVIYVSGGVFKSASTFLYELTEEVFRAAGRRPLRIGRPLLPAHSVENFFEYLDAEAFSRVERHVAGRDAVLKTHLYPTPDVIERIVTGEVLASVSIRDPREMALSMLDHGARNRRLGRSAFAEFHTVRDTWPAIDQMMFDFQRWAAAPGVRVFTYNDICFRPQTVVAQIAEQIGADVAPAQVTDVFADRRRIGQFNLGVARRYRAMDATDQAAMLERYAEVYQTVDFEAGLPVELADAPLPAAPAGAGRWVGLKRVARRFLR